MFLHVLPDGGAEADVVELISLGTQPRPIGLRQPTRLFFAPLLPGVLLVLPLIIRLLRLFLLRWERAADLPLWLRSR